MNKKIIVLGAGISGLTTAYLLKKKGFDVLVVEKEAFSGGKMVCKDSPHGMIHFGPHSIMNTHPAIINLIQELKLEDEIIYPDKKAKKRYILKHNQLHPLPMNLFNFIDSKLFSFKAKLKLILEMFIPRNKSNNNESVACFTKRRLGREFLDYAIDPFVSGVFAGDSEKLNVRYAFPKLYKFERKYRSFFIGAVCEAFKRKKRKKISKGAAQMFSFKNGMHTLPNTIVKCLMPYIRFNLEVERILKNDDMHDVYFKNSEDVFEADLIISTLPLNCLLPCIESFYKSEEYSGQSLCYPTVLVLFVSYQKSQVGRDCDGFGFLIPEKEKKSFLGCIWNSSVFPEQSDKEHICFTLYIGGAKNPKMNQKNESELILKVLKEFHQIMDIHGSPVYQNQKFWKQAIPQYGLEYEKVEKMMETIEKLNPGLFLTGNYRGGISVSDCIINSYALSSKIINSGYGE